MIENKTRNKFNCTRIELIIQIGLILGIILFVAMMIYINLFHYTAILNADSASEAVLARLIWDTKDIRPDSWYASTEQRVIGAPNWAALIYGITGNAKIAMGMSCSLMLLSILLGLSFLSSEIQVSGRMKLGIIFLALALPLSMDALQLIYLFASYYGIHVLALFIITGYYAKVRKEKAGYFKACMIQAVLAFLLGMQGFRGILILFIPLAVIATMIFAYGLLQKTKINKNDIFLLIWSYFLLLCSYLGTRLPGSVPQSVSRNIRNGFSKFWQVVVPDLLSILGFSNATFIVKLCLLVLCIGAIGNVLFLLLKIIKRKDIVPYEWFILFLWCSLLVSLLAVAFTTIESSNRYGFMAIFILVFSAALIIHKAHNVIKYIYVLAIFVLSIHNISENYLPLLATEEPPQTEAYAVVQYMEEQGYKNGYATFENANVMTVLSEDVRVVAVASVDKMEICKWLSSSEWYVPNVPYEQDTIYIITETEMEQFKLFKTEHEDTLLELARIGKYHLFLSPYNYSNLGK